MYTIIRWSPWIHSSGSGVIPDMSWFSVNQTLIDWPSSFYTTYPCWSMYLNLIHRYGNHNSFVLKPRIILMLLSSDAFAFILLWLSTDTYTRLSVHHPTFGGLLSDKSYMASSMCQLDSSCEIPSLPLDDLCYHRQPPLTPSQCRLSHV